MKRRVLAMLLVAVMMLGLVACGNNTTTNNGGGNTTGNTTGNDTTGGDTTSGETFKIGSYLQLTGSNSVAGNSGKQVIDLAIKYINENGGFNGATVVHTPYDTQGSTEEAVKVVQKMLTEDYDAIIGSVNSNEVSACISYINDAKVYNFGLGTSATWMEDESMIYTFRASCNNNRIAPLDVDLIKELGYDSVAIMNGTDDTGASTADAFEAACKEKGVTVTTRQQCDSEDTDFTGQITQIINSDPDCVFMSLIGTTFGPFVKQLRNMGYTGMIGCKECFSAEYQNVAGGAPNTNYIFYVYPYVAYTDIEDCNIPNMREFLESYQAEYGELPAHEAAYRGWDTMMAMWEASKIAGANDDESLREATHKVVTEGLGGTMDFTDGSREAYSNFNSFILIDGKDILVSDWKADGGYEAYLEASGRDR